MKFCLWSKYLLAFLFVLGPNVVLAQDIFVSTKGSDKGNGSLENPFSTIEKAIASAIDQHQSKKPVTIYFRGGTYMFDKTIHLSQKHSYLRFAPWKDEYVVFFGGVRIPTSLAKKVELPANDYQPKRTVFRVDLKKAGIQDFGKLRNVGFARPYGPAWGEIFVNGQALHLARWPNGTMIPMGKVLQKGSVPRDDDFANVGGLISYDSLRINRWKKEEEPWMAGYFMNGYADDMVQLQQIDTVEKTFTTASATLYGFGSGAPWRTWYGLNLLSELDTAGEFYIDKKRGILHFMSPETEIRTLEFSVLESPFFTLDGANHVCFEGITFEVARGMGIAMANTQHVTVKGCTFRKLGSLAISIGKGIQPFKEYRHEGTGMPQLGLPGSLQQHLYANTTFHREGGNQNTIINCEFYELGAGGVSLGGGNRLTLDSGKNRVENSVFRNLNRIEKSYRPAVHLTGVGNIISHCEMYDLPSMAILMHGNDHMIEYNYIHDVCLEVHDMGAFYYGRDPSELGTILQYNYFENIPDKFHTSAVYHDDGAGGLTVRSNVFYKAGLWNNLMGGGSGNTYSNNIFIGTNWGMDNDNRLQNWASSLLKPGGLFEKRMKAVNYQQSPFRDRYPQMVNYFADSPAVPKNNLIEKNIFADVRKLLDGKMEWFVWKNNNLETTHQWIRFADWENRNFSLDPKSPVFDSVKGFEDIPFHKIGLIENSDFPTIRRRNGFRQAITEQNRQQWENHQVQIKSYHIQDQRIWKILDMIKRDSIPEVFPNPNADAQWFRKGNFGLFMHWGPHSTQGSQPSWAMIKHYPYGYEEQYSDPDNYFVLANDFDPKNWNPDKICKAAKDAGMTYAVLTVKHHDGFALWPSKYGNYNIGAMHPGRDLLRTYVEACRKNGLRVGFYFSQQDWHFPDYPLMDQNYNFRTRFKFPDVAPAINDARYDQWLTFTIAQLQELLTSYGKIDVLWFDGFYWPGQERRHYTDALFRWIRTLQPSIVINDRWNKLRAPDSEVEEVEKGDFATIEWKEPKSGLEKWWEFTTSWSRHWGNTPLRFDAKEVLAKLVLARSMGGNFLINIGPAANGEPPQGFYESMRQIAGWVQPNHEALFGEQVQAGATGIGGVPVTQSGGILYAHLLPGTITKELRLKTNKRIKRVYLVATGKTVRFKRKNGDNVILLKKMPVGDYQVLKVELSSAN